MSNAEILAAAAGAKAAPTENELARDEDFSKAFAPVVQLAEVETKTGEEDEQVTFKIRAKLFRFSKETQEWKERGTGDVRLLQHKTNKKIRLLMRREKTLKICMNQFVNSQVELKENVGSDRSWMWQGVDYADGERDEALLAIRFRDSTNAGLFKDAYDEARKTMAELAATKAKGGSAEPKAEDEKKAAENGAATAEEKDATAKAAEESKGDAKEEDKPKASESESKADA